MSEIKAFLRRKWARELDYRLIKELWACHANRIAVRFAYEWHDDSGQWFRSYGNENWEFDEDGLMRRRIASINDLPIAASDRKYHWAARAAAGRPSLAQRPGAVDQARGLRTAAREACLPRLSGGSRRERQTPRRRAGDFETRPWPRAPKARAGFAPGAYR